MTYMLTPKDVVDEVTNLLGEELPSACYFVSSTTLFMAFTNKTSDDIPFMKNLCKDFKDFITFTDNGDYIIGILDMSYIFTNMIRNDTTLDFDECYITSTLDIDNDIVYVDISNKSHCAQMTSPDTNKVVKEVTAEEYCKYQMTTELDYD